MFWGVHSASLCLTLPFGGIYRLTIYKLYYYLIEVNLDKCYTNDNIWLGEINACYRSQGVA